MSCILGKGIEANRPRRTLPPRLGAYEHLEGTGSPQHIMMFFLLGVPNI